MKEAVVQILENAMGTGAIPWYMLLVGLLGQIFFSMRFLLQWLISEKQGRSVMPISFWFCSIGGAALLLAYSLYRQDPIFILGQSFGFIVYTRNLMLIKQERGELVGTDKWDPDEDDPEQVVKQGKAQNGDQSDGPSA